MRFFELLLLLLCVMYGSCVALSEEARSKGFVYLREIDPSIRISLRYQTDENFVGQSIKGYEQPVIILTKKAAEALKKVQETVKKDGYSLVIYDAYRPVRSVAHFIYWSEDVSEQRKKSYYYPRVHKVEAFTLGYVGRHSSHSRGSTVDLSLIKEDKQLHPVVPKSRTLLDGFSILFLDDGTVDMGSSFDLFDVASHTENSLIEQQYKRMRIYLKTVMENHGFKNYPKEWWHFTLINEPYTEDEFDFVVA